MAKKKTTRQSAGKPAAKSSKGKAKTTTAKTASSGKKSSTAGKAKASQSTGKKKRATQKPAAKTSQASSTRPAKKTARTGTKKTASTRKTTTTKKTAKSGANQRSKSVGNNGLLPLVPPAAKPVKIPKTKLSPKDLEEFRQLLLDKRRELLGDVLHMEDEAIRPGETNGGNYSAMPIHMADIGSDTWEQELTLGLIETERGLLTEIEQALARIDNKTFGMCLATGKPISKARLRAKPWAKYCIEYARKREMGLV